MAQQVKMLMMKPDDLSSVILAHRTKGESKLWQIVLEPSHMSHVTNTTLKHTYRDTKLKV